MANRLFGGRSRRPEADLISEIQRISRKRVGWGGLSSGDKVDLEGTQIDVLWPPRTLIDSEVLKVIRNAINDFGEAKKKDNELRKLYDAVEKAGKAQPYLKEEEGRSEPDKEEQVDVKLQIGHHLLPTRELPPIVARANKSLRSAANHLSLHSTRAVVYCFWATWNGTR